MMQGPWVRIALVVGLFAFSKTANLTALAAQSATPGSATPKASTPAASSRYGRTIARFTMLDARDRADWLSNLFATRAQTAARIALDAETYGKLTEHEQSIEKQVRQGKPLSGEELLLALEEVDRVEQAAIENLAMQFRRTARDVVGAYRIDLDRRWRYWQAIRTQCEHSPDPFGNQPRLIEWLQNAILEQRISAAPKLPAAPDFFANDNASELTTSHVSSTRTALLVDAPAPDADQLSEMITRYNASIAEFEALLYRPGELSVEQLNNTIDRLARLGLERVRLATDLGAISEDQRSRLTEITPIDTAVTLLKVKAAAARRGVWQAAGDNLSDAQFAVLNQLNAVSQRLATLAAGPDR
jgi:hypothetical protein